MAQKWLDNTGLAALWGIIKERLALKQDKLTAGDNVTIVNGIISSKDTTYAEVNTTHDGLISSIDKHKLDTVAYSATNNSSIELTFLASDWMPDTSYTYTQTVAADGVTDTDNFGAPEIEATGDMATDKINMTNLSYISGGTTGPQSVTLYCCGAKPTSDLTVYLTRRSI